MLEDVVIWVILPSLFSDFLLCILLFWHLWRQSPPSQQCGEAPEPHNQSMDVGAGQESSRDGTPTSHKPLSSTFQAHTDDACEQESIPSLQQSQDCCLPPFPRKQTANPCNHRDQQSMEGSGISPRLSVAPGKLLLMRQEKLSLG